MAMQGKSTSGDKPSLDMDEAEAAADAFRPSWDAGEDAGLDTPPTAPEAFKSFGAVTQVTQVTQAPIVGTPVVNLAATPTTSLATPAMGSVVTAPPPAPVKAPIPAPFTGKSTVLGG